MANKTVLSTFGFSFSTTLTLLHTVTTMGGMSLFAYCGLFTPKTVPTLQVRSSLPTMAPCPLVLSGSPRLFIYLAHDASAPAPDPAYLLWQLH